MKDGLLDVTVRGDTLRYWQERLRLRDWDILVTIGRMGDLGAGTLGDCDMGSGCKRQAKIRLLHPDDITGQQFWFDSQCWDWELTLVHELLHIHLQDCLDPNWNDQPALRRAVERAVDWIAKALVAEPR